MASSSSQTTPKTASKELCSQCEQRTFDLICTCGGKFDFNCIQQHIQQVAHGIEEKAEAIAKILHEATSIEEAAIAKSNTAEEIVQNWKRKRIQDINDIAEEHLNNMKKRKEIFKDLPSIRQNVEKGKSALERPTHERLDLLTTLHSQLTDAIGAYRNVSETIQVDNQLDEALLSKLNPAVLVTRPISSSPTLDNREIITTENVQYKSELNYRRMSEREEETLRSTELVNEFTHTNHKNESTHANNANELIHTASANESIYTNNTNESIYTNNTNESTTMPIARELVNTIHTNQAASASSTPVFVNGNHTFESLVSEDEFDPGLTRQIERNNPIIISATNDKFAGTVCMHDNQLLYSDYDPTTISTQLVFIPDINDPRTTQNIDWNTPDLTFGSGDNEWIQDISYSPRLSGYLLLNRARLRLFKHNPNELCEFQAFPDCLMKRVSSTDAFIYLVVAHHSNTQDGDEIIIMNYDKQQEVRKTSRDIMPNRINRGAGPLVAQISDIAVVSNEQMALGYRLERRHEVGICLFKVSNNGKEWSCIKQLLLDDCWHNDLSYTPRLDWCPQLNAIIIVEYLTGHLVMLDRDGQVKGECRFMNPQNQKQSPMNFALTTNNWLCVRFESSISIHKIIP